MAWRFTQLHQLVGFLVSGIAAAGSGIGTFVFAPLTEWLIDHYTWRGFLIITSGILLNIVLCGAVFRPLPDAQQSESNDRRTSTSGFGDVNANNTGNEKQPQETSVECRRSQLMNNMLQSTVDRKPEVTSPSGNETDGHAKNCQWSGKGGNFPKSSRANDEKSYLLSAAWTTQNGDSNGQSQDVSTD